MVRPFNRVSQEGQQDGGSGRGGWTRSVLYHISAGGEVALEKRDTVNDSGPAARQREASRASPVEAGDVGGGLARCASCEDGCRQVIPIGLRGTERVLRKCELERV